MDRTVCFECGGVAHHQHHVVPRSQGGTKTIPLCVTCHGLAHGMRRRHADFGSCEPDRMPPELADLLNQYRDLSAKIATAKDQMVKDRDFLIRDLPASGYTLREVAELLRISVDRVHQLRRES